MRHACQVCAGACFLAAAFDLALSEPLRRDAMEQRPEQVLHAARAEFCQRHLDRPLAAQHGVAGGQEGPRVVDVVPDMFCSGDHARQTRSDPARTVRKCEQIIMRVLERRASGTSANDSDEADTDRAVSLFPRNRLRQGLLAKLARRAKRGLSLGVRVLDRISGDPSVR